MTALAGSVNLCPICWHDHEKVPLDARCPQHGHRLQLWRGWLKCPGRRCRYALEVAG